VEAAESARAAEPSAEERLVWRLIVRRRDGKPENTAESGEKRETEGTPYDLGVCHDQRTLKLPLLAYLSQPWKN